ncbi:MAG: hypothetical protein A3K77_04180 [Euryarchaeota archaeon RBG_13_31_8]|nr:MAG: hypothetical protein A3K77_04180 [Euryarchaeota archaeon RBG_13_31_8]
MNLTGLKEIQFYYELLMLTKKEEKEKMYSRTDIGKLIDGSYPNQNTHNFIKKLIMFNILKFQHNINYKGKTVPIYLIDDKKLLEIVVSTEEYKMLKEFYNEETVFRVVKPIVKK